MTRSERLAEKGKVEVYCLGGIEMATVIKNCNSIKNIRYIGTDYECLYSGKEVSADIYESKNSDELYAVIG